MEILKRVASLAVDRVVEPSMWRAQASEELFYQRCVAGGGNSQAVIPAQAGIHFDVAVDVQPPGGQVKIRMDPSVRWDDGNMKLLKLLER